MEVASEKGERIDGQRRYFEMSTWEGRRKNIPYGPTELSVLNVSSRVTKTHFLPTSPRFVYTPSTQERNKKQYAIEPHES